MRRLSHSQKPRALSVLILRQLPSCPAAVATSGVLSIASDASYTPNIRDGGKFSRVMKKTPAPTSAVTGSPSRSGRLKGARRLAVIVIIVSVSIAAAVGIITVLTSDFGEIPARILGTTSLVAGLSITALCHLAIVGRHVRSMGYVGLAASLIAFVGGVVLIWGLGDNWTENAAAQDIWLKIFAGAGLLAIFLAQSNLLLLLSSRRRKAVRASLAVTLVAIALVYVLVVFLILTDGNIALDHEELYFRVLSVIAIIDALGTVLLPVLAVFIREGLVGHERVTLNLPHESASLLAQWSAESGQTPEDIVSALLLLGREVESE
jgi:hypothetical protein